ncbi:MAG: hypothetical protein H0W48_04230 [Methylibium sp.]|nr:hypothetical protein [Methylibium sp.]
MTGRRAEAGPEWSEIYIPLAGIIKHRPFQIRKRLDAGAVRRYREMARAGKVAPPIQVALIGGSHYLLDGWHRMEAGALTTAADDVLVKVAEMTEKQARWVAAEANTGHGVPLKAAEMRTLFGAFIKSGQHKKANGVLMSYREMGEALAKPHTTIRNWVAKDFPRLFRSLRADGIGNPSPGMPPSARVSLDDERISQAHEAARTLQQIGDVLTSADARGDLVLILQDTLRKLQASGKPIAFSEF